MRRCFNAAIWWRPRGASSIGCSMHGSRHRLETFPTMRQDRGDRRRPTTCCGAMAGSGGRSNRNARELMRRIHVSPTAADLSLHAAQEFVRVTADAVKLRSRCFVALAGGNTPRGLYRALANTQPLRTLVPWARIEFFWSDERHVPPDDPESNYR